MDRETARKRRRKGDDCAGRDLGGYISVGEYMDGTGGDGGTGLERVGWVWVGGFLLLSTYTGAGK